MRPAVFLTLGCTGKDRLYGATFLGTPTFLLAPFLGPTFLGPRPLFLLGPRLFLAPTFLLGEAVPKKIQVPLRVKPSPRRMPYPCKNYAKAWLEKAREGMAREGRPYTHARTMPRHGPLYAYA